MPKPKQESKMIIIQLKTYITQLESEKAQLESENAQLKEENLSLKVRLDAYQSKHSNYPSPTTVKTGMR